MKNSKVSPFTWLLVSSILLMSLIFQPRAQAGIFGADISYKQISGDTLLVQVSSYMECQTGNVSAIPVNVYAGSGSLNYNVNTNLTSGTDVTPICKGSCSYCTDAACRVAFGIRKYYLTCNVVLNDKKYCDYIFSWQKCCLSTKITTGASFENFYISCSFNKCIAGFHNSPSYTDAPIMLVCRNACASFFNTALVDGNDSVSYAMVNPLSDKGSPISFNSGYSYDAPLIFSGDKNDAFNFPYCYGFHFDSITSQISFKATKNDITILSLEAREWKKDSSGKYKIVGTSNRSVCLMVLECDNHTPIWVKGFTSNLSETTKAYAGLPFSYDFEGYDPDGDSMSITRKDSIAGTKMNINAKSSISGTLSWTPKNTDINKAPYPFTLRLKDKVCPIPAIIEAQLLINVDSFPKLTYSKIDSGCGRYYFMAKVDTARHLPVNWYMDGVSVSNKQAFSFKFKTNSVHYVHLRAGNQYSGKDYYDTIKITDLPVADAGADKTICKGDSVQLNGKGNNTLQWKAAAGIKNTNLTSPYVNPLKSQYYTLVSTNNAGCKMADSVLVKVTPFQWYNASSPAIGCPGDTVSFTFDYPTALITTTWKSSPFLIASSDARNLKAFPQTTTSFYALMKDKLSGCTYTDTVNITVDQDCVYPGDINKDKIVNYLDLLPLAIGLNTQGPARSLTGTSWKAVHGQDWQKTVTGINYKFLDCNGNGYIAPDDTIAISRNYNKSHNKKGDGIISRAGKPAFYLAFDKTKYLAGDTVRAGLYLGTADKTISAIGAGLKYAFGNPYILSGSYNFKFGCDFFCDGFINVNMYHSNGLASAEGAVIRPDNKASVGFGKVADISYILVDSNNAAYTKDVDTLHLQMLSERVIDDKGNEVLVDPQSGKALIYAHKPDMPSSITMASALSSLSIYPNPFNNEFTLSLQLQRQARVSISCFDALGREVSKLMDKDLPAANNSFNFQDREAGISQPGIYFIKVQVGDEVSVMRMVKM